MNREVERMVGALRTTALPAGSDGVDYADRLLRFAGETPAPAAQESYVDRLMRFAGEAPGPAKQMQPGPASQAGGALPRADQTGSDWSTGQTQAMTRGSAPANGWQTEASPMDATRMYGPAADVMRLGRGASDSLESAMRNVQGLMQGGQQGDATIAANKAEMGRRAQLPENQGVPQAFPSPNMHQIGGVAGDAAIGAGIGMGAGALVGGAGRLVGGVMPKAGQALKTAGEMLSMSGMRPTAGPAMQRLAQMVGNVGAGAATGAAAGAAIDPEHMGLSAAIGGAMPVAGAVARGGADLASEVVRGITTQGQRSRGVDMFKAGIQDPQRALQNINDPRLAGNLAPPMGYQAAADPGAASMMQYLISKGMGPEHAARLAAQNTQQFSRLEALGGSAAAVQAAQDAREAATRPLISQLEGDKTPVSMLGPRRAWAKFADSPLIGDPAVRGSVQDPMNYLREKQLGGVAIGGLRKEVPVNEAWQARRIADRNLNNPDIDIQAIQPLKEVRGSLDRALKRVSDVFADMDTKYAAGSKDIRANKLLHAALQDISGTTQPDASHHAMQLLPSKIENLMKYKSLMTEMKPEQFEALVNLRRELLQNATALRANTGGGSQTASLVNGKYDDMLNPVTSMLRRMPTPLGKGLAWLGDKAGARGAEQARQQVFELLTGAPAVFASVLRSNGAPALSQQMQQVLGPLAPFLPAGAANVGGPLSGAFATQQR